ncbi:MAG: hypothetical protein AAGI17_03775 [Planctomycetota bacterium]
MKWLLAVISMVLVGCGERAATPAEPESEELRLVALSPAIAVMLRDLGLEDRIVGRHEYDLALSKSIPSMGHQQLIDYEALIEANPTHVILEWGERDLPGKLTNLAGRNGWAVMNYRMESIDQIAEAWDDLALDLRGGGPAEPIDRSGVIPRYDPNRLETDLPSTRLASALRPIESDVSAVGGVLLLAGGDPPGVLGPGSVHHEVLVRLGAVPAIAEGSPWMSLDLEDMLGLAPGAIVLVAPRTPGTDAAEPTAEDIRERLGRLGELAIPAIESGRVALIDDPYALLGGSAIIDFAGDLREILEGWARD